MCIHIGIVVKEEGISVFSNDTHSQIAWLSIQVIEKGFVILIKTMWFNYNL